MVQNSRRSSQNYILVFCTAAVRRYTVLQFSYFSSIGTMHKAVKISLELSHMKKKIHVDIFAHQDVTIHSSSAFLLIQTSLPPLYFSSSSTPHQKIFCTTAATFFSSISYISLQFFHPTKHSNHWQTSFRAHQSMSRHSAAC